MFNNEAERGVRVVGGWGGFWQMPEIQSKQTNAPSDEHDHRVITPADECSCFQNTPDSVPLTNIPTFKLHPINCLYVMDTPTFTSHPIKSLHVMHTPTFKLHPIKSKNKIKKISLITSDVHTHLHIATN